MPAKCLGRLERLSLNMQRCGDITTWARKHFVKHVSVNTDACKVLRFIDVLL